MRKAAAFSREPLLRSAYVIVREHIKLTVTLCGQKNETSPELRSTGPRSRLRWRDSDKEATAISSVYTNHVRTCAHDDTTTRQDGLRKTWVVLRPDQYPAEAYRSNAES